MLALYRLAATLARPWVDGYLDKRVTRGKEDPARIDERRGIASRTRPDGPLAWMHAASVGESVALLPLIGRLRVERPDLNLLVTTGTVTSAATMARRLPDGVLHQFVPVDRPAWVRRFLDHWHPELAIWIESDLWPNLVLETRARRVPMVLLDARMSVASYRGWRRGLGLVRPIFAAFDLILAAGPEQVERFRNLGGREVRVSPSLKAAGAPPPVDNVEQAALTAAIGGRPVWLASNTHPGEEEIVLDVQRRLLTATPGLLCILAPRHPDRAEAVAALAGEADLKVNRRSSGVAVSDDIQVYLVDSLGQMGTLHAVLAEGSRVTFLGGSLVPVGGHNPMEAAHAGLALLFGPMMPNNRESADELLGQGAAVEITDAETLLAGVRDLMADPENAARMGARGQAVAAAKRAGLDRIMAELAPLLPVAEPGP
jgi:3-deoxy-D-manno-octulosonic-acid transferase